MPTAAASATRPHFKIGRDREGHWIAVETHGRGGGYFRSRDDALHYARAEAGADAVSFSARPLALRLS
ncbi:hypothetical protein WBO78_25785 [Bosea sp. CCNWLW174]|uniref:DUF2188 domain-containing protein n=1 Tax=Bosea lupini TaxID=1036779 RepID=A0A1H7Y5W3_9HYPH|nr:hypothetical protein [Bosea lupini]SEM40698.1 hypothetical protein SAMN04515666_11114 [Bosea lupini]